MSTFGRAADIAAARRRQHEYYVWAHRARLDEAVAFAIATLADSTIADAVARRVALVALREGRAGS